MYKRQRLSRATYLLVTTNKKISSVAYETGFTSISSFNRAFKKHFNQLPNQVRHTKPDKTESNGLPVTHKLDWQSIDVGKYQNIGMEQINITQEQQAINLYPWQKLINFGMAEDLLQYDVREHMKILKDELNFEYIRFWNLFTKGMDINPQITTDYNFEKIDSVLDYLSGIGIKPFIELSYKVKRIHRTTKDVLFYNNSDYGFESNQQEWYDFFNQFLKHIVQRYGLNKISTWKFELTFDYNQDQIALEEQMVHYKKTYQIIKSTSNAIEIGGPGAKGQNQGSYNYQRDLLKMIKNNVKFDFISYMLYPYYAGDDGAEKAIRTDDTLFLMENIKKLKAFLTKQGLSETPLYITEWSNTISNRNELNDSLYKGAYLVKNLLEICDLVEGIGYWVGSDLFGEFLDSNNLLHGGTGLLTTKGIKKTAFFAIDFMNRLAKKIIYLSQQAIVTIDEENVYPVSYTHLTLPTKA